MTGDLYPVELTIENLYCYRGKHTLKLGRNVYAILAAAEDNPARSNWLGKSTLLMAFAFALNGWHTKRTDEEIITHGEEKASVGMKLNDGTAIVRTKAKGKSMQVRFTPAGGKPITQGKAQDAIDALLGFSREDFFATFYFRQKRIGELVTAGAAERQAMVEGWLAEELQPVQQLHAAAVRTLKATESALHALEAEQQGLKQDMATLVEERGEVEGLEALVQRLLNDLQSAKTEAKRLRGEVLDAKAAAREWATKVDQADRYARTVEQGQAVRKEVDGLAFDLEARAEVCRAEVAKARAAFDDAAAYLKELHAGQLQFDGTCPVACKACPSAEWVEAQGVTPEALEEAKAARDDASNAARAVQAKVDPVLAEAARKARLERELVQLRAKAEQLMDAADEVEAGEAPPDPAPLEAELEAVEERVVDLTQSLSSASEDQVWAQGAQARLKALDGLVAAAKHRNQVATEAVALTGKHGAQQAIQELVMAKVERRANDILTKAGIDLQLAISWGQETKGLAKVCSCGAAFPTSQRVKACQVCGAVRGPNVLRKLTIQPTNESGAAEDLAGIALGIATSQWLRAQRGSRWGAVFVDEPFGALDPHNRAALGTHIVAMLRSAFSSAFVVAHERAILSAMPGRINIVAGPNGSRIEGTTK